MSKRTPQRVKEEERKSFFRKITRDIVMFGLGAIGFLHELLLAAHERPYLIAASLGLMGAPFALRFDQLRRENGNGKK